MSKLATVLLMSVMLACASVTGLEALAAPAPAREATLTAEQVVGLRTVGTTAISPDGRWIAYVLRVPRSFEDEAGGARSQIWIVDRKGRKARQLTATGTSSSSPRWSPDGASIAFLSTRKDRDEHQQVYLLAIGGGEARKLTDAEAGVARFEWSPDGSRIAYTADVVESEEDGTNRELGKDELVDDKHGEKKRLWALDLESGKARPITRGEKSIRSFEWSPDGTRLVVRATDTPDTDADYMFSALFTVDAGGGDLEPLCRTEGKLGDMAWSPDGERIAFLGAFDLADPTAGVVHVVSAKGGAPRALTADLEATGRWIEWMDSRTVVFSTVQGTRTSMYSVLAAGGRPRPLVEGGPICSGHDLAHDRRAFACAGSTAMHPREVFVGRLGSRTLRRLTTSNPDLATVRLGEQKTVRWAAEDGMKIAGVLTLPVGYEPGKRYPLAVLVHGGPEGVTLDGWLTRAGSPAQLFATHGYVVLQPNYRGSSGRGVAFGKADQKDLGGKEFEDVLAGIDKLVAEGLVDADRVGMGGWSYGGYFAALAATKHTRRFKAAMIGAAITDWISFTGTTDIEAENSLVHWALWPWDELELVWSRSPLAHAKGSKTASLIVHGQSDRRVPVGQAHEIYRALRRGGVPAKLVVYPREPHGLREQNHQLDFVRRYLEWFDVHVKGAREG